MDEKFIVLEHIDTSNAAKNFSNLLSESRTYFLMVVGDQVRQNF